MTKLIKIYKNNCVPCAQVSGYLESKEVEHEQFNIMEHTKLAEKYGIMSVPVTILLDDEGNEIGRSRGFDESELDSLISKL